MVWPVRTLARREVGTGHGRVIGADPPAEQDLHDQHDHADHGPATQAVLGLQPRTTRGLQRHPPQQRHRRQAAGEVRGNDGGFQQQRHRPHAEQPLEDDEPDGGERQADGLQRILPIAPGQRADDQDDDTQRRREIPVQHLLERLRVFDRTLGERGVRGRVILGRLAGREVTVATGPVGAPEAGMTQAHVGAQHDDAERQDRAEQAELVEHRQSRLRIHRISQPMCESLNSFFTSVSRALSGAAAE